MTNALARAKLALEGLSVADAFGEQLLHAGPAARVLATEHHTAPVDLGTVIAPSGALLIIDAGLLGMWSHDGPPLCRTVERVQQS